MGRIVVNQKRCKGCGLCVEACPKSLLRISASAESKTGVVLEFKGDEKVCIGCAICAKSCPDYAIVEVYR